MSSRRFEPPSTSKFVIFQGEHKGPKRIFLIWGAPKPYQTLFVIHVLICIISESTGFEDGMVYDTSEPNQAPL